MKHKWRRVHFLRISKITILQLVVQVVPEHTAWFTDAILEELIARVRLILSGRFRDIMTGKKSFEKDMGKINFSRGDNLQFAYYFEPFDSRSAILTKKPELRSVAGKSTGGDNATVPTAAYDGFRIHKYRLITTVEPVSKDSALESTGTSSLRSLLKTAQSRSVSVSGPKTIDISSYFEDLTEPGDLLEES